jgi:hypothetical protein
VTEHTNPFAGLTKAETRYLAELAATCINDHLLAERIAFFRGQIMDKPRLVEAVMHASDGMQTSTGPMTDEADATRLTFGISCFLDLALAD